MARFFAEIMVDSWKKWTRDSLHQTGCCPSPKVLNFNEKKGFIGRPYSVVVVMPQFAAQAGNLGHHRVVGKI
jgi:hypothetical protein